MSKFTKEEKKELVDEVFFHLESNIKKTKVTQCKEGHTWRKLNDTEIACTLCPTVNIVDNADDYAQN